jgi:hypothetical protein
MIGKNETKPDKPKPGEELLTTTEFVDLDFSEIIEINII